MAALSAGAETAALTRAGKLFYQKARTILAQAAEAANEARAAAGAITGSRKALASTGGS